MYLYVYILFVNKFRGQLPPTQSCVFIGIFNKLKKNKQHNCQKKRDNTTNNDLQSATPKTKDWTMIYKALHRKPKTEQWSTKCYTENQRLNNDLQSATQKTKDWTMIYKVLHRKPKTEQHKHHNKTQSELMSSFWKQVLVPERIIDWLKTEI